MEHHLDWLQTKWWGKLIMAVIFFGLSYLVYVLLGLLDSDIPPSSESRSYRRGLGSALFSLLVRAMGAESLVIGLVMIVLLLGGLYFTFSGIYQLLKGDD